MGGSPGRYVVDETWRALARTKSLTPRPTGLVVEGAHRTDGDVLGQAEAASLVSAGGAA